jgi:LPXTG-motif cell wall-anchored protein
VEAGEVGGLPTPQTVTARLIFSILMILALTTGAAYAQSTINTTAPGPTQQQEPGQTNNNLPNPGNPVELGTQAEPVQEGGTVTGTATESLNNTSGTNTTGSVTGTMPETETGSGMDVDVDTGSNAAGAMDVDVNSTTDTDTDASGVDETGSFDTETDSLPATGSELPLVALIGLLALAAAFAIRRF